MSSKKNKPKSNSKLNSKSQSKKKLSSKSNKKITKNHILKSKFKTKLNNNGNNSNKNNKIILKKRPVLLMILDGFGLDYSRKGNAVKLANMPYFEYLINTYPDSKLEASQEYVGLPHGQIGNSEIGHLTIGSGRIIDTDLQHINKEISNGEFFKNLELNKAMSVAKKTNNKLHLMGLLSDGGVHSHINHLFALLKLAKKHEIKDVYIHCFLDGRDVPPKSAAKYIRQLEHFCKINKIGKIATLIGRFYGMDRDNRWKRENQAYQLLVDGIGRQFQNKPLNALNYAYSVGETDEFIKPILVEKQGILKENDSLIFFNFRSDRAREITKAFTLKKFNLFERKFINLKFTCLTLYDRHFKLPVAFPLRIPKNTLGEVIASNGLKQLRIAETEKYPHVTFFFNGGIETPNKNETRIVIPSPKVLTYDLKPIMSAKEVTKSLVKALKTKKYDLIILNYANPDMVGHTGSMGAVLQALEELDPLIEQVITEVLSQNGVTLIIADHGNCEKMYQSDGSPHTAHTTNSVPCVLVDDDFKFKSSRDKLQDSLVLRDGLLSDVAPTLLYLLGLEKPKEMTGKSLIEPRLRLRKNKK